MRLRRQMSRGRQTLTDVFGEVRERVSAQDAARRYGAEFNRRGWCRCPFHDDRHASMSFKSGRFRCWSCNASGDAVDFTARLFGLEPLGAVKKLNADFRLGLELDKPPDVAAVRQRQQDQHFLDAFMLWRDNMTKDLCECFRLAHLTMKEIQTPKDLDKLSAGQVLAIQQEACLEYLSDALISGTAEQQMEVFRERGRLSRLVEKILGHSCQKSKAA